MKTLKLKTRDFFLIGILIFLIAAVALTQLTIAEGPDDLYDVKLKAYQYMADCMAAVHGYRDELGIPINLAEDIHDTGLLGIDFSDITTSLGSLESKRTSTSPDMAALVVELLSKAGVTKGSRVAANFSGSFPGLSIAVLTACRALEAECVYIMSIGSSTYGANLPELTFPDMACRLYNDGLIPDLAAAFSVGGSGDVGNSLDPDLINTIVERIKSYGVELISETDFAANNVLRQSIFEKGRPVDCFISTGGNVTSLGRGERSVYIGEGLVTEKPPFIDASSGLLDIYADKDVPVVHMLNLKRLTADYGLPYDPMVLPEPGTSAVFMQKAPSRAASAVCLAIAAMGFIVMKWRKVK